MNAKKNERRFGAITSPLSQRRYTRTTGTRNINTFFQHEESPMCTSSALTLKLRLDNREVPKTNLQMRNTIDLIKLFSHDSHYQVQNDFCFWKRRVLFLSVYFGSTSHTLNWSCRKTRKVVQYSYNGFWVIRLQNRLLDGMYYRKSTT